MGKTITKSFNGGGGGELVGNDHMDRLMFLKKIDPRRLSCPGAKYTHMSIILN